MHDTGAKCRKCRREGEKLFLKGERCGTQKCAIVRRHTAPGQSPKGQRGKVSEYGKQLREKQKAKRIFGVTEKVFSNYYEKASGMKGITGDNILKLLELRMDNVVYKSGFVDSRNQARQLVTHGIFELNGRRVDIPSISLKIGDKITVRAKSSDNPIIAKLADRKLKPPRWLNVELGSKTIEIVKFPEKDEFDKSISINLIVEFYSR